MPVGKHKKIQTTIKYPHLNASKRKNSTIHHPLILNPLHPRVQPQTARASTQSTSLIRNTLFPPAVCSIKRSFCKILTTADLMNRVIALSTLSVFKSLKKLVKLADLILNEFLGSQLLVHVVLSKQMRLQLRLMIVTARGRLKTLLKAE